MEYFIFPALDGRVMKNKRLIPLAKNLRKRATDAERLLWRYLRAKRMEGIKFRRQEPIGNYIVDFICFDKRIIVEIDGGQHARDENVNRDKERDEWLRTQGFKVLRFWNNEVLNNINGVWEVIRNHCFYHPPLAPPIEGGDKP